MRADGEHDMQILVGKAGEAKHYALVELGDSDKAEEGWRPRIPRSIWVSTSLC